MPTKPAIELKAALVRDYCRQRGYPQPVTELVFAPPRHWRFDLAWPSLLVALEFQGGGWVQGRHTRGAGHEKDCEKFSTAAVLGWRVLLATVGQLERGDVFGWLDRLWGQRHG